MKVKYIFPNYYSVNEFFFFVKKLFKRNIEQMEYLDFYNFQDLQKIVGRKLLNAFSGSPVRTEFTPNHCALLQKLHLLSEIHNRYEGNEKIYFIPLLENFRIALQRDENVLFAPLKNNLIFDK